MTSTVYTLAWFSLCGEEKLPPSPSDGKRMQNCTGVPQHLQLSDRIWQSSFPSLVSKFRVIE